jgi:hypothetical protein
MKLPPKSRYLIFVRPVGSLTWTQHMKTSGVPYVAFNSDQAFEDACAIAENERTCTHVARVDIKSEPDEALRATDSTYAATYFLAASTENQAN